MVLLCPKPRDLIFHLREEQLKLGKACNPTGPVANEQGGLKLPQGHGLQARRQSRCVSQGPSGPNTRVTAPGCGKGAPGGVRAHGPSRARDLQWVTRTHELTQMQGPWKETLEPRDVFVIPKEPCNLLPAGSSAQSGCSGNTPTP